MCQWGANRNPWAGYRIGPSPTPMNPKPRDHKSATTDRGAHHVGSSSGLITNVVMTLSLNYLLHLVICAHNNGHMFPNSN